LHERGRKNDRPDISARIAIAMLAWPHGKRCGQIFGRHPLFVLLPRGKSMEHPRVAALQQKWACDETIQMSDEPSR
jgi:hypothetical protein